MNISLVNSPLKFTTKQRGDTFDFLEHAYYMNGNKKVKLKIGDEVIIHPALNFFIAENGELCHEYVSQATQSYPARIVVKEINWSKGRRQELCLKGIRDNKDWHGAVLNFYAYSRLEFVQRSFINTFLEIIGLG